MANKRWAYLKGFLYIAFRLRSACHNLVTNLGPVWDVFARECGTKVLEELAECRLIEKVEHFVLGDDKLDEVVNQASRGERGYTWLMGKGPIKRGLTLARSHHKHPKI